MSVGLLLLGLVVAVAVASKRSEWDLVRDAPPLASVSLSLALPQHNVSQLTAIVSAVSDPRSSSYGHYLSKHEVMQLLSPPADEAEAVMAYVRSFCGAFKQIEVLENRGDSIRVKASAECVQRMLGGIRLADYRHKTRASARCIRLHPESSAVRLPEGVEHVFGLGMFPVLRKKKTKSRRADEAYQFIDAAAINRVYNITNNAVSHNSTLAMIEFSPEGAPLLSDLQTYDNWNLVPFYNVTRIVGPWNPGNDGESSLDVQLASAVAHTPLQYVTIEGWVYEMASELFSMPATPLVSSVSYGWPEALSCETAVVHSQCDAAGAHGYVQRSEIELQKLAAIGTTVVVCSQDEGAPSEHNSACLLDLVGKPVWPVFPGSSAWVTSVGGTTLLPPSSKPAFSKSASGPPICQKGYACATAGNQEVPCMLHNTKFDWTTGGGFSEYVHQPAYQQSFVATYLKSGLSFPPARHFNSSNRAYPDVAAFGSRMLVVAGGGISVSAGTSASTPIIAAVLAIVNDRRLALGKPPLGFFNPVLYDMMANCPSCFNDVTTGDNRCTNLLCCRYGYYAGKGYDAVSGAGTPNVGEWIAYLTAR